MSSYEEARPDSMQHGVPRVRVPVLNIVINKLYGKSPIKIFIKIEKQLYPKFYFWQLFFGVKGRYLQKKSIFKVSMII